jgi:hypothetical protein
MFAEIYGFGKNIRKNPKYEEEKGYSKGALFRLGGKESKHKVSRYINLPLVSPVLDETSGRLRFREGSFYRFT